MNNLKDQFLLDPEIAYLNHGSYGACPRPVFEAYQKYQKELETEPATLLYRNFSSRIQEVRESLSDFLNCGSDQIAFVRNATYGMNMVAQTIKLGKGDKVLATEHEYGAVERMWEIICKERGAKLVKVELPLPVNGPQEILNIIKKQADASVKVITFPHITAATAQVFPAKELVKIAKEIGAISVIDGAHAPGQISLNLNNIDADFYVGNCHKWMLSPKGAGFVYASRLYENKIRPPVISWGNISDGTSSLLLENDWQGTTDISSILAIQDSINFLKNHDWFNQFVPRSEKLIKEFNLRILEITGMRNLYAHHSLEAPQMRSYVLPDSDYSSLHHDLFFDFKVELPIFLNQKEKFFRISVQAYNENSDLERLIEAIEKLI